MRRLCSLLLVIGICFTFLPVSAFAAEQGEIAEREAISGGGKSDAKQEITQTDFTPVCNDGVSETDAKAQVEDMVNNNEAVKHFETSKLKEATTEQRTRVVSALQEETTDTTAQASLAAISDDALFHYVSVEATSATVTKDTSSAGVVVKTMSFEVKPMVSATVAASNGMKTVTAKIPNKAISSPITFRLPISSGVATGTIVDVKHDGVAFGSYVVQEEKGDKYIELRASSFSVFSFELTEQVFDTSALTVTKALELRDSTDINLHINKIPTGTTMADYTLKYSFAGGETKEMSLAGYTLGNIIKVAECASIQYTQTVSADIYYKADDQKEVLVCHRDLSVEQYCEGAIDSLTLNDDALKELCARLLEYGYYAQEYFKASSEKPSSEYRSDIAPTTTIPSSYPWQVATGTLDAVSKITLALELEHYIEMNYYIMLSNTADSIDDFKIEVGVDEGSYVPVSRSQSGTVPVTKHTSSKKEIRTNCTVTLSSTDTAGMYRVKISGIPFVFLHQTFYLKVTKDDKVKTVYYSPMAYASKWQQYDESLGNLLKALYNYHNVSKNYFKIVD